MFNGKMKAVTFSYDDGVTTDEHLIEILDRYGLKCTFNINTASHRKEGERPYSTNKFGATVGKFVWSELRDIYKNHEVAAHSLSHPHLEKLDRAACRAEMLCDMINIEAAIGKKPVGMAYPFGSYSDETVDVLRELGLKYARGTWSNYSFDLQDDLMRFRPTLHHNDERLMELCDKFIDLKPETPKIFYIWGHTYEFENQRNWDRIERFCDRIAGRDDIFYGTNEEVLLAK